MTNDPYAYQWNYVGSDPYRLGLSDGGYGTAPAGATPSLLSSLDAGNLPEGPASSGFVAKAREQQAFQTHRQNLYNRLAHEIQMLVTPQEWQQIEPDLRSIIHTSKDLSSLQDALLTFNQRLKTYLIDRARARMAREVESIVYDPNRLQAQQAALESERELGKRAIEQAYRLGNIANAQVQARKGMLGSSVDIENRAALTQQRNANMLGLESGLQERARAYRLENENLKQQLLGMIYSDDPMQARQFASVLDTIRKSGELYREQAATSAQMAAVNQAAMAGYSQAIGGGLSAAAPAVYIYAARGSGG